MTIDRRSFLTGTAGVAAILGLTSCANQTPAPEPKPKPEPVIESLIVETDFTLTTSDPARVIDPTGALLVRHLYQNAVTYADDDLTRPVDGICTFVRSGDLRAVTLTMRDRDARFSDGSPVTAADVAFTLQRTQGIQAAPAFLLDGLTITQPTPDSVLIESPDPAPPLVGLLNHPSLGIVNKARVLGAGGSTDSADAAEAFLNASSQGSGPYLIESWERQTHVVLRYNPLWNGEPPRFRRIVLRNATLADQLANIRSGESDMALDLGATQIAELDAQQLVVNTAASTSTLNLYLSARPGLNPWTSNDDFQEAMRRSVDHDALLKLTGASAQRVASIVPGNIAGAPILTSVPRRDVAAAVAALANAGYQGEPVPLHYADDRSVAGVTLAAIARQVRDSVAEAGINLELHPSSSERHEADFRAGTQPAGLMVWKANYPDPRDYLAFLPGGRVAELVPWAEPFASQITPLADAARVASLEERLAAYSALFEPMAQQGPFIALFEPLNTVVARKAKVASYTASPNDLVVLQSVR